MSNPEPTSIDVTENLPTIPDPIRSKMKKGVAIAVLAAGVILLIDDQIKKVKDRKTITVAVTDTPEND